MLLSFLLFFFYAFKVLLFHVQAFFFGGQKKELWFFLVKLKIDKFKILIINSTSSKFRLSQSSNMILMLFLLAALDYIFKVRKQKWKTNWEYRALEGLDTTRLPCSSLWAPPASVEAIPGQYRETQDSQLPCLCAQHCSGGWMCVPCYPQSPQNLFCCSVGSQQGMCEKVWTPENSDEDQPAWWGWMGSFVKGQERQEQRCGCGEQETPQSCCTVGNRKLEENRWLQRNAHARVCCLFSHINDVP